MAKGLLAEGGAVGFVPHLFVDEGGGEAGGLVVIFANDAIDEPFEGAEEGGFAKEFVFGIEYSSISGIDEHL
ncbi:MAG: hypothetical protein S4CHLAM102_05660 [Chlamydiia bacterium]|nr:hypothetical protein [Chlamydiia bacterium]